jgi:hypothetical protein
MTRREMPEEIQLRLAQERRCREISDAILPMLPAGNGFVLLLATISEGSGLRDEETARFSSTSYVSNLRRQDTQRLLHEFADHCMAPTTGRLGEPTAETASRLREFVHKLLEERSINELKSGAARALADTRSPSAEQQATAALLLAAHALALFELNARRLRGLERSEERP